jgi:Aspartyl protease
VWRTRLSSKHRVVKAEARRVSYIVIMKCKRLVQLVIVFSFLLRLDTLFYAQSSAPTRTPNRLTTVSASQLDELVVENRYLELQRNLPAAELTTPERTYFEGILADRTHHVRDAIALLEKVLPELKARNAHRAALALRALASDYFEASRYGDSAGAYATLLKGYGSQFPPGDLQGFSDNLQTHELLRGAPAQLIMASMSFTVPTQRDALGNTDVPVKIGKTEMWWMFDTGANISTISLSTAKRLGLAISKGRATTQSGATGNEVPLHTAIIPELGFGSALIHNAVVLVMDDKELDIDLGNDRHHAIQGILGYPVLSALESVTFFEDRLDVAPASPSSSRCAPLYVQDLTPLIAVTSGGKDLVFSLDTGASTGTLTARYFHAFAEQFATLKPNRTSAGGAGGVRFMQGYTLPSMELRLGTATATLHDIVVLTEPLGTGVLDSVYGNLGQALLAPFRSYTIDFSRMQLCLGEPRNRAE